MIERMRMQEKIINAAMAAPPTSAGLLVIAGIQLADWVQILTILWLLLLIAGWMWDRIIRPWQAKRIALKRAKKAHEQFVMNRVRDHEHRETE